MRKLFIFIAFLVMVSLVFANSTSLNKNLINENKSKDFAVEINESSNEVPFLNDSDSILTNDSKIDFLSDINLTDNVTLNISDDIYLNESDNLLNNSFDNNISKDIHLNDSLKIDNNISKTILNKIKKLTDYKLKDILSKKEFNKLTSEFKELRKNESKKVIIQYVNNKSSFKSLKGEDILTFLNKSLIKKIWPDRETILFLDDSVPLVRADALWSEGFTGNNITVAILDTGIVSNHEMFNGTTIIGEDFTGSGSFEDGHGHGTHVAGIVAGHANYTGVAPNVTLLIGKVLTDSGSGYLSWLIEGIEWAVLNNADIISLSLGATYTDNPEDLLDAPEVLAVENAIASGVVVVIASGNCGEGCGSFTGVTTPGLARNTITVGAVDENLNRAHFSSGMQISDYIKPDIVAPGVNICSSYLANSYTCLSGTSMATPFVAGAVALMLDKNESYSPSQIKELLKTSAVDLGASGIDTLYGSGFLNISAIDFGSQFSDIIKYTNVVKSPIFVNITATFFEVDSAILKIFFEGDLIYEGNYSGDFNYSFEPSFGSYSVSLNAYDDEDNEDWFESFNITNYYENIPTLVAQSPNIISIDYFNVNISQDIDIRLTLDEFNSISMNQTQYIEEGEFKRFNFIFSPRVPGIHSLDININDEEIITQDVYVGYPELQQSIQGVMMR